MSNQDSTQIEDAKKWQLTPTTIYSTLGVASTAGLVDLAAHLGPNGLLLGAIATVIAARHGEDFVNGVRDRIPQSMLDAMAERFHRIKRIPQAAQPKYEYDQLQDEDTEQLQPVIDMAPKAGQVAYLGDDDDETVPLPKMDSSLFTFSDVLATGFTPSVNKIFVGRTMEGKDIFVPAEDLCHVALAGKTGGGKGSLMRLLMVQLCYIGAKVLLLNPHYMRWVRAKDGPKFDEDWTPFEGVNPRTGKPYLEAPPTASADSEPIEKCLTWTVERLLQKRRKEGREGGEVFLPYFIVIDEWPDIASEIKKAPSYMGKLLRQGRKYGIFVIVASQDFQVKTLGMEGEGGSVRKCLLTCFYTGGDPTTAKELLYSEKPSSIPENKIGKGIVLLRCTGTKNEATLAKVPFVDNAAVYTLLGDSTFQGAKKRAVVAEEPEAPLPQAVIPPMPAPTSVAKSPDQGGREITLERIIALLESGQISEKMMFELMSRLPSQSAEEDEMDDDPDESSHLRLVSREAVEDDYHSQETERLPETTRAATGRFSKSLSPDLLRVYNSYEIGKTHREIAKELGNISHPTVGKIIQRLKDKGAIDPSGRKVLVG